MVDGIFYEMKRHETQLFPAAAYEWYAGRSGIPTLECHWHYEWEFFSITTGKACFTAEGGSRVLSEGDVVFLPGGALHMAEPVNGEAFEYRAVVFNPHLLLGADDISQSKYVTPVLEHKIPVNPFLPKASAEYYSSDTFSRLFACLSNRPFAYELICKSCLFQLFALALSVMPGTHSDRQTQAKQVGSVASVQNVIAYIHDHYTAPLTVKDLCAVANMSEGHFSRLFKKYTSKSPIDYVLWVRLAASARLLIETDHKLTFIADETGFNSVSYFIRCFTAYYGCPPAAYRRMKAKESAYAGVYTDSQKEFGQLNRSNLTNQIPPPPRDFIT